MHWQNVTIFRMYPSNAYQRYHNFLTHSKIKKFGLFKVSFHILLLELRFIWKNMQILSLVLDSFGKPPSGILYSGNFKWIGEYNECTNSSAPAISWYSKYCFANPANSPFVYGVCFPVECSSTDISSILNSCNLFFFRQSNLMLFNWCLIFYPKKSFKYRIWNKMLLIFPWSKNWVQKT